jgi:hypothetical protein
MQVLDFDAANMFYIIGHRAGKKAKGLAPKATTKVSESESAKTVTSKRVPIYLQPVELVPFEDPDADNYEIPEDQVMARVNLNGSEIQRFHNLCSFLFYFNKIQAACGIREPLLKGKAQ